MDRLAAMEVLMRVIETGSFSVTARQLGVGQPAISKSIAQLEARLGVQLVSRSSRRVSPTEAGQNFYERAKRALEEADEADLAARGAGAGLLGRLRFSAPVTFARLHVIPRLPQFLSAHPELTVEAILDDRNIDLIGEGIDVALRMGTLADSAMTARRIGQSPRFVLGTSAYFERTGVPENPDDLERHQAVIYLQGRAGATWTFRKGTLEASAVLKDSVRTTAAEGVREAVLAGLGLCVASAWMFEPELKSGRVMRVMGDWSLPPLDLWATFPAGRHASAKARAFAVFVENEIRSKGSGLD